MMFQLIGVPGVNQRAREVLPFKSSLTSTGLYVILSRKRILFWAGSDFFANYLEESWSDSIANVIGEELINKLVFMYENS